MRVRDDWKRFSVATLLLCLFAAFAISPPEYHRCGSSNRTRTARAARLDDHDHDHALGATDLSYDIDSSDRGDDRPAFETLLPPGGFAPVALAYAGAVVTPAKQFPSSVDFLFQPGRGPPSLFL
jgi:hypothetical protein